MKRALIICILCSLPLIWMQLFPKRPSYLKKNNSLIFSGIYDSGEWLPKKGLPQEEVGVSLSGVGSFVINTAPYRDLLADFLRDHKIKSVVDFGCGDWAFSQLVDWGKIRYTGVDAAEQVVELNKKRYGDAHRKFLLSSKLRRLPKGDLLICKDVLQHWSHSQIMAFLPELKKYKHCLITNGVDPETMSSENPQIPTGAYRHLDLTKPPYSLKGEVLLVYSCITDSSDVKQVLWIDNTKSD